MRTRLAYGTKPFHGLTGFAEFENIAPISPRHYWNGTVANTGGQTLIADPKVTEINQAFGKFARKDWLDSSVLVGIRKIILDDARFVGNVGWRQNEQTYDSATLKTSFGVENLELRYAFLWKIRRIFGDQGTKPNWTSRSHLMHVSYPARSPQSAQPREILRA